MVENKENPTKVYYLIPTNFKVFNIIISLIFTIFSVACAIVLDKKEDIVLFLILVLFITAIILDVWTGYMLLMRIKIEYNKQTILIFYRYGIKKFNFDEIDNIQIKNIDETSFELFLSTEDKLVDVVCKKYSNKKVNEQKIQKANEIKNSLMSLPQKHLNKEVKYNKDIREGTFKFYKKSYIIYSVFMAVIVCFILVVCKLLDLKTAITVELMSISIFMFFMYLAIHWPRMKISISLDEGYVYIFHYGFNKKIEIKDIKELSIIQEYSDVSFKFRIVTKDFTKEFDYNKYLNQNITNKQRKEILELKELIKKTETGDGSLSPLRMESFIIRVDLLFYSDMIST